MKPLPESLVLEIKLHVEVFKVNPYSLSCEHFLPNLCSLEPRYRRESTKAVLQVFDSFRAIILMNVILDRVNRRLYVTHFLLDEGQGWQVLRRQAAHPGDDRFRFLEYTQHKSHLESSFDVILLI